MTFEETILDADRLRKEGKTIPHFHRQRIKAAMKKEGEKCKLTTFIQGRAFRIRNKVLTNT